MTLIGQRTYKVDYWRNSNQKRGFLTTALLDRAPRFHENRGYKYLHELRVGIQMELGIRTNVIVAAHGEKVVAAEFQLRMGLSPLFSAIGSMDERQ